MDDSIRLLCSVTRAAQLLDMSRSKLYELLASGEVASVKIGGSRRIALDELRDYVLRLSRESDR